MRAASAMAEEAGEEGQGMSATPRLQVGSPQGAGSEPRREDSGLRLGRPQLSEELDEIRRAGSVTR